MRLSMIDNSNLTDLDISNIVFSDIYDNGLSAKYALVFGHHTLYKLRTQKAVQIYNFQRAQKLIFLGGVNRISNQNNSIVSESEKMKEFAVKLGVKKDDILTDSFSNNTFENIDNAFKIIGDEISTLDNILLITSEFHLKRCYAIIHQKYPGLNIILVPVKDGHTDSDNWFLSDNSWNSGRSLVTYEANLLIKYAKEQKLENLEIKSFPLKQGDF